MSGPPAAFHTEQQQARDRRLGSKRWSMFCATQHVDEGLEQDGVEVMVVSFGKLQHVQHPPRSSELLFEGTMGA